MILQEHATVRSPAVEVLLEISKVCDVYLIETILDDDSEVKVSCSLMFQIFLYVCLFSNSHNDESLCRLFFCKLLTIFWSILVICAVNREAASETV